MLCFKNITATDKGQGAGAGGLGVLEFAYLIPIPTPFQASNLSQGWPASNISKETHLRRSDELDLGWSLFLFLDKRGKASLPRVWRSPS